MWSVSWKGGAMVECEWSAETQRRLLRLSLLYLKTEYEKTGWRVAEVDDAMEELIPGNLFVFVGPHIVCLSECRPWFSAERVLTEEFVDPNIGLDTVVDICRHAANVVDVRRFTVGTRAAANQRHAGLAKLYQKQGLSVSTVELVGVIHGQQENQEDRG
jgi:hypothetical protein